MEILSGGLTLDIPQGCFPLSTDSVVLADFVPAGKYNRILDLGSGCATLGLLLRSRGYRGQWTGIERDETAHRAATENIERNGLQAHMQSICADLREMPLEKGSVHCVISNPPYFSAGAAGGALAAQRHTLTCSLQDLVTAARQALCWGGDFYLVHKPETLAQLCFLASQAGLEPKRLRLVRHRPDSSPSLIALQCRKGGKPGLIWEELTLYDSTGAPTADYRRLYHL